MTHPCIYQPKLHRHLSRQSRTFRLWKTDRDWDKANYSSPTQRHDWDQPVTRLRVRRPRNLGSFPGGSNRFSYLHRVPTTNGVQQPSYTVRNDGMQPGFQADHSIIHLSSAEVKNEWSCTSFHHTSSGNGT